MITFESLDIESLLLHILYISMEYWSGSHMNVIRSRCLFTRHSCYYCYVLKVFMWLLWANDWCQWKTLLCVYSSSVSCLWVGRRSVCYSAVRVPRQLSQLVSHATCLLWTSGETTLN